MSYIGICSTGISIESLQVDRKMKGYRREHRTEQKTYIHSYPFIYYLLYYRLLG